MPIPPIPIKKGPPSFTPPGPPVNAGSSDSSVPAVQGASFLVLTGAFSELGSGIGVAGNSGSGIGVQGSSDSGTGVKATSTTGNALVATAKGGSAVVAQATSGWALQASSSGGIGGTIQAINGSNFAAGPWVDGNLIERASVVGQTGNASYSGVCGASQSFNGVVGISDGGTGVQGLSNRGDAIQGTSKSPQHAGVSAVNDSGGFGVWARGSTAGYFEGKVEVNGDVSVIGQLGVVKGSGAYAISAVGGPSRFSDVEVTGTLTAEVDIVLGSDCAEDFDVAYSAESEPGTVMVLTDNGALEPSRNAYDKKVAGVISGAGTYKPGLILGRCSSSNPRVPLALVGKVYCKVDAQYGPIEVGDPLTTSATPGHAMRAIDQLKAFGAVIGKALQPLTSGTGLIAILVALQ